jgi:hypothetical protein
MECPGEELAPEVAEFGDNLRKAGAAGPGGGQGRARCHDAALLFVMRGFRAQNAVFDAENEISPDSLKEGFNCRDLPHTWFRSRNHRGERMENTCRAVAL